MAVFFFTDLIRPGGEPMPRTDDLRIREMKELTPPSHLIREFGCSDAAARTAASRASRCIASCTARTTA
jgi:hypothetical protein